ncbi:OrdA protein [Favolaschia claudopus]|uniref:OrdA protein n=1 Tax=Favolaschia claudopus TaxID=2862362 RepID=A0AAW0CTC9_9AGAR
MMQSITIPIVLPLTGVLSFVIVRLLFQKARGSLPPGPAGLPLIGNVLDMPSSSEWLRFAEWGVKWGQICSVTLLGQPIVILNSASVMEEVDSKTAVFCTRPRLPMAGELVGYDQTLVLMSYGPRFRTYRKYFAKQIGSSNAVARFVPMIEAETHRFLRWLLLKPTADSISTHLRKLTGAIILRITYGIEVQEEEDPFVALIEKANDNFNAATQPGAFLVDVFPAMLQIPEIFAPFKQTARVWARATKNMVDAPYSFVQKQISNGTAPVSFVSSLLEEEEKLSTEDIRDLKFTAASFYGGGADTTAASLHAFFLAMVLTPDVQRTAQIEIDSVVGSARLPQLSDREQLPYTSAVVTELLRWHSVAPLGVPHAAMQDTVVNGHFIPKGSIMIANLWNMLNDPKTYPDPGTFNPSRYLSPSPQRDPRTICFGFGRRVCPGKHLAEVSLFCAVAAILATFEVSRAEGPLPVHENTQGTISQPKPFECVVKARSARAVALISTFET